MSVDPSTLTQTNSNCNPPINSWDIKWTNTIITNITSSKQLETQCMNAKCEIATDECECIKRVIFIMHFFSIWINVNSNNIQDNDYLSVSLSEFVMNLKYYSTVQLTNDWLHLRQFHWTDISIQYNTRNIFESIIGKCGELEKCSIFARVNRDREKFKNNETRKRLYFINNHKLKQIHNDMYNESTEVTTQQLCDSIHDCIFHVPIIFLPKLQTHKITQHKDINIEQKYDNNSDINTLSIDVDEFDDDEWDMDASEVSMLRLLSPTLSASKGFSARKCAMAKLKNTNSKYFQHSKFVTSVAEVDPSLDELPNNLDIINKFNAALTDNEDNEDIKTDVLISKQPILSKAMSTNLTNSIGSYEFGIELMYSQHFQKHAKWSTMKDETLKNENAKYCISINQWTDTIKKAQHCMQCIRGKLLSARNNDKSMNINIGDPLNVSSMVSCLLYTNFTDLQRRFSGSTRRYNWQEHETDDDIRIKHYRDYYHWGKTLMVFICCFGDLMNEKLSFYHGISIQLLFGEFTAYFNCPTSTTISLSIASSFASGDGIILKLSGRAGVKTKTKFMDVSWFSDYPNEEERLFYGQHNELEIRSIFHGNYDYKRFIRAIKVLDILTDPSTFIVGQGGKRYAKLTESKYYNHLLSMIKNFIEKDKYKKEIQQQKNDKKLKKKHWKTKEIPSNYLQNIFNYFCQLQTTISIDCLQFAALLTHKDKKHELAKYFLIKQHAIYEQFVYCLNIPVLTRLFPKVKFITLDFGGKPLQPEQFEYSCKHVALFLNQIKKNPNKNLYNIETINMTGVLNSRYKYVSKDIIRQTRKKYFSNTRCKVEIDKKNVQFTLFGKQKLPFYENIFVGNLHHIETPKSVKSKKNIRRNKQNNGKNRNIQMRKNRKKKKDIHVWTMFLSTSKQKMVKPKTIKRVVYYLDTKIFKKSEYPLKKSPFILRQKGDKIFKVNVKVIFRGKRKDLHFEHLLDFDHAVTITNVIFDQSRRKHTKNDVFHSSDYQAFDYYNIHNL